jgi:hypothetical protein
MTASNRVSLVEMMIRLNSQWIIEPMVHWASI